MDYIAILGTSVTNNIQVVGIDYCGRFIDAAKRIQTKIAHGQFTDGLHLMDPTDIEASCIEFKQVIYLFYIQNTLIPCMVFAVDVDTKGSVTNRSGAI